VDVASRLHSVVRLQGQAPRALIGGRWVRRGEQVAEWQVLGIDEDAVHLGRGAKRITLRLWSVAPVP
jgi:hypothetical protein